MTPTAGNQSQHPELYNAPSVYISNASDPRFNGICTDTKITPNGQLSCTQSSSTGATSATAEVSYGTSVSGNTGFNLWSGAEVLRCTRSLDFSPTRQWNLRRRAQFHRVERE